MTEHRALDEVLRVLEGDAGCDAGEPILDEYVEIELRGDDPSRRFPGTALAPALVPGLSRRSRRAARGRAALRRRDAGVTR